MFFVFQERDCLASQLDKIEEKAMKLFTTMVEHDVDEIDLDTIVAKQIVDLKTKLGLFSILYLSINLTH